MSPENRVLDISWGTILKLAVSGLVLYILFLTRNILVWVLFGVILSLLFDPVIDFLQRKRVPRVVATVGVYLFVFGVLAFIVYGTSPLFIQEIQRFSKLFPTYFETLSPPLQGLGFAAFSDIQTFIGTFTGGVEKLASSIFSALFAIFGGIFATVFVISIAIFLSLEEKGIERGISVFFSKKYEALALDVWAKSQKKVSAWFVSRLLSSLFVGGATYITLAIFNVQYPFSLSLIAGVLNFVPVVGPLITALLIALVVAADSGLKVLFVLLAFTLIQQIEGTVITPLLTKKFIGLSPVLVLISLAVGAELWGIMGAILAIPIAGILFEFLRDFLKKRKEEKGIIA